MGTATLKPLITKAEILMESLKDKLTDDFDNNKEVIKKLNLPFSKQIVNRLAGYIAKTKRQQKKKNN